MIYVKILHENKERWGVLENGAISLIVGTPYENVLKDGTTVPYDEEKLLAPCDASKVVCVGKNYADHAKEMGGEAPTYPILFIKPSTSINCHMGEITYPEFVTRLDYEAELAFVIKKEAKKVKKEEALDYILGYTCLNDVTARDIQQQDGQWTRAKSMDTFCPIGPFVTDEVDVSDIEVAAYLNGELKQRGRTSEFITKIPEIIEFITQSMTLLPGDVVATGTPSGIGPMAVGDVIEVRIENIASLINKVVK